MKHQDHTNSRYSLVKDRRLGKACCATGPNPSSLFQTGFSAASLRRFYDGPITLLTDFPPKATTKLCESLRIDVRRLFLGTDDPFRSRYLKTQLAQLTPYERTIFLDADTLVLKPIDALFQHELALALDARVTVKESL